MTERPAESKPLDPTDQELMLRFAKGDVESFDALVQRHCDTLVAFFSRCLRGSSRQPRAEEAALNTFVGMVQARREYHPGTKFSIWMYRIAYEVLRGDTRGKDRARPAPEAGRREAADMSAKLLDAMDSLPHELRAVVVLRHYHSVPAAEIAQILGTDPDTVWFQMHTALQDIRRRLARPKKARRGQA